MLGRDLDDERRAQGDDGEEGARQAPSVEQQPPEQVGGGPGEGDGEEQPHPLAVAEPGKAAQGDERHRVRADAEEERMPEAENPALPPDEGEAHGEEAVRHVLRELARGPGIERRRAEGERDPHRDGKRDAGLHAAHRVNASPSGPGERSG